MKLTLIKRFALKALVLFSAVLVGAQLVPKLWAKNSYKCIAVIDVLIDQKPQRIRLAGIDAPERAMPFYDVAKQTLAKACFGKMITVNGSTKDRNGRLIATIFTADNVNVCYALVANGLAWHYKQYSTDATLAKIEKMAQAKKLGIRQYNNLMPPWEVRALRRAGNSVKFSGGKAIVTPTK